MGPGKLPETTVGKPNPPCHLQIPTKALSCKKEAISEHGPEAPSCPVGQGSFKMDCLKVEKYSMVKVRSHQTRMMWIAQTIYMLSQCKDAKSNPAALFARMRWRELSVFSRDSRELKNLNFGGYSRRVNQSGACSSSDVITSGWQKIRNNNGGQSNCGCMWVPGAVYTSSYFYKNRNTFCNETEAAWQKPLPWREFASVV